MRKFFKWATTESLASGELALLPHAQNLPSVTETEIAALASGTLAFLSHSTKISAHWAEFTESHSTLLLLKTSSHFLKWNILHQYLILDNWYKYISRQNTFLAFGKLRFSSLGLIFSQTTTAVTSAATQPPHASVLMTALSLFEVAVLQSMFVGFRRMLIPV